MNYIEGNKEFIDFLKAKGIKKYPHFGFVNLACSYFGFSDKTVKERIRHMHQTGLIENDGQNWVLK